MAARSTFNIQRGERQKVRKSTIQAGFQVTYRSLPERLRSQDNGQKDEKRGEEIWGKNSMATASKYSREGREEEGERGEIARRKRPKLGEPRSFYFRLGKGGGRFSFLKIFLNHHNQVLEEERKKKRSLSEEYHMLKNRKSED